MELLLDHHAALGTAWWIEIAPLRSETERSVLRNDILTLITTFEQRYSRFRYDSLIARLNRTGACTAPDHEFIELLEYGRALYTHTDGHFNFLTGSTLSARGYGTEPLRYEEQATPPNPHEALTLAHDHITLSAGAVDCGGFGKGYLIDRIATLLTKHGIEHFLINGGGDLYGTTDTHGTPFTIYLEHPTTPGVYIGTTTIAHQGFAASSPFRRQWVSDGETMTHLVGTKNVTQASFVTAPTAARADAFATASLVHPDPILLAQREEFGLLLHTPKTNSIQIAAFSFSPL